MRDRLLSWRSLAWIGALVFLCLGAWWLRVPFLRAVGGFLVSTDAPEDVDAVYTLGGAGMERGIETARVMRAGWAPHAWFTGGNVPSALQVMGIAKTVGLPVNIVYDAQ